MSCRLCCPFLWSHHLSEFSILSHSWAHRPHELRHFRIYHGSWRLSEMEGNDLSSLWDFLRQRNLQEFAVDLIRHGVRSRQDILVRAPALVQHGMAEADVSRLLAGLQQDRRPLTQGRADLPVQHPSGPRASLTLALVAAQPNNRKRSLDALDRDILSRTSQPAQESRLRTFRAICAAWEVA